MPLYSRDVFCFVWARAKGIRDGVELVLSDGDVLDIFVRWMEVFKYKRNGVELVLSDGDASCMSNDDSTAFIGVLLLDVSHIGGDAIPDVCVLVYMYVLVSLV